MVFLTTQLPMKRQVQGDPSPEPNPAGKMEGMVNFSLATKLTHMLKIIKQKNKLGLSCAKLSYNSVRPPSCLPVRSYP